MEAFCGKWRMDREGCEGERQFYEADNSISDPGSLIFILEGEREFYEADGSIPDPEMIDKILEADCIVSMTEVTGTTYATIFFCINHHTGQLTKV